MKQCCNKLVQHRAARCRVEIERLGVLENLEYKGLLILEARVVAAVIKENQTNGYYLVMGKIQPFI